MQELPTKEEEEIKSIESLGKQKLKRGRPARSKVKKTSKYIIFFFFFFEHFYYGSDSALSPLISSAPFGCVALPSL